jgi:outer membrane protein OmpA-like peptidoglycan-associated protein
MRAFPTGIPKGDQTTPVEIEGAVYWFQYNAVEGAPNPSGLQFMRNFENATKAGGGTIEGRYPGWCKASYDPERMPRMGNGCLSNALTMKFVRGAKELWAFLQASDNEGYFVMTIVEREAMKQGIAVNELADKLAKDGFVALYINFDTGKATIRPDSSKTLDDAAAALKASPAFRVEVAGHTDNVGTPEANLTLSQDRAQAVMGALVARGVAADRMRAKGYGQTVPVGDNRTEQGRAKNRRVELVKN